MGTARIAKPISSIYSLAEPVQMLAELVDGLLEEHEPK
jgi:hypothetical protein